MGRAIALVAIMLSCACHKGQAVQDPGDERERDPAGDAAPAEIRDRAGVVSHHHQRARLRGRYESRPLADLQGRVWSRGPFLVLADDTLLFFEPATRDPAEIAAHEGREVEVIGVILPPPAPSFDIASVTVESLTIVDAR